MKRNAGRVRFRDSRILTDSLGGSISPLYLPLIFGSAKRKELLGRSARKRTVDEPFTIRPQGQARNSLGAFEQNKTFFLLLWSFKTCYEQDPKLKFLTRPVSRFPFVLICPKRSKSSKLGMIQQIFPFPGRQRKGNCRIHGEWEWLENDSHSRHLPLSFKMFHFFTFRKWKRGKYCAIRLEGTKCAGNFKVNTVV